MTKKILVTLVVLSTAAVLFRKQLVQAGRAVSQKLSDPGPMFLLREDPSEEDAHDEQGTDAPKNVFPTK
jgi:hypothetical protein